VELPGGGRKPLTAIFVSIAESGERKTTVDRLALAPVYDVEEEWRNKGREEANDYHADLAAWEEAVAYIRRKGKGNRSEIRDGLIALGQKPVPPAHPMLLIADPTPEGLTMHLAEGRPWCGVFTAEGGTLIGGAAFADESRMRTAALLNSLWDGEPIRRRRVGTGPTFLPGRRSSAHVMMQQVVANRLLGDSMLDGIGLRARVLTVAPESTAGTRLFREPPNGSRVALETYGKRIRALLTAKPATRDDDPQVLDPPVLQLSADARQTWIAFADHAERAIGPGGEWQGIRAFGAKAAEHAARLAAVLTLYANPDEKEIPGQTMADGIRLVRHYAAEALRLAEAAAVAPNLLLAARLLEWWRARPDGRCYLAKIYQRSLNAISDASTARRIVRILHEHGYLQELRPGTELDGAPRREAWELVRYR
jgi:hypothetical protein